jgi:hypothetical protein
MGRMIFSLTSTWVSGLFISEVMRLMSFEVINFINLCEDITLLFYA